VNYDNRINTPLPIPGLCGPNASAASRQHDHVIRVDAAAPGMKVLVADGHVLIREALQGVPGEVVDDGDIIRTFGLGAFGFTPKSAGRAVMLHAFRVPLRTRA